MKVKASKNWIEIKCLSCVTQDTHVCNQIVAIAYTHYFISGLSAAFGGVRKKRSKKICIIIHITPYKATRMKWVVLTWASILPMIFWNMFSNQFTLIVTSRLLWIYSHFSLLFFCRYGKYTYMCTLYVLCVCMSFSSFQLNFVSIFQLTSSIHIKVFEIKMKKKKQSFFLSLSLEIVCLVRAKMLTHVITATTTTTIATARNNVTRDIRMWNKQNMYVIFCWIYCF